MESLLSLSFDNISSRDHGKIRKGLRQIEGLLAQICLSSSKLSPSKRKSSALPDEHQRGQCKKLGELRKDAAFREFFRLQEGFRWNVASRLVQTLERLMSITGPHTDTLILSTLSLIQGLSLLHPPSRCLFASDQAMNAILDLLDPKVNPPAVQSQALLVLVSTLMGEPRNTRCFERVDGLLTVTSLFKSRATTQEVRMRTLEFLYFYLMPEHPPRTSSSLHTPEKVDMRRDSKLQLPKRAGHARTHSGEMDLDVPESEAEGEYGSVRDARTTEQKQKLLGKHLSNVADLVRDLKDTTSFGSSGGAVG